jgi:hypothetical protein
MELKIKFNDKEKGFLMCSLSLVLAASLMVTGIYAIAYFEAIGLIKGQWQIVPALMLHVLQWWLVMRVVFKHYKYKPSQPTPPQKDVRRIFNFERQADERIAILEMLLWKYNTKTIPDDVFERLKENGFLEKIKYNDSVAWTDLSKEISDAFNSKFNYN